MRSNVHASLLPFIVLSAWFVKRGPRTYITDQRSKGAPDWSRTEAIPMLHSMGPPGLRFGQNANVCMMHFILLHSSTSTSEGGS